MARIRPAPSMTVVWTTPFGYATVRRLPSASYVNLIGLAAPGSLSVTSWSAGS
jgi:hypothetical protein